MTEKIKVSKDVAEAIEYYDVAADSDWQNKLLFEVFHSLSGHTSNIPAIVLGSKYTPYELAEILVKGHEIEKSPDEKVHELYWSYIAGGQQSEAAAIRVAFTLYDIKIEGVNT